MTTLARDGVGATAYSEVARAWGSLVVDVPGRIGLVADDLLPPLQPGEYEVETLCSGISTGTDLTFFTGTNPYRTRTWDPEYRLFRDNVAQDNAGPAAFPRTFGYMQVGRVVASRNDAVAVGEVLGMAYGHRTGRRADASTFTVALPKDMDPLLGIYAAQMGPVCVNGILHAADEHRRWPLGSLEGSLCGARVAIFGAGVVGLLHALLARWCGADTVAVIDRADDRLAVAAALGFLAVNSDVADPAIVLKDEWGGAPAERGADLALQCTASPVVLSHAIRSVRDRGSVIDLGFYQEGAGPVQLGEEFHHNHVRHICAQIGAVPVTQQAAWDRRRLSEETLRFLAAYGPEVRRHLITDVLPFSAAQQAFEALRGRAPGMLQVVLMPDEPRDTRMAI